MSGADLIALCVLGLAGVAVFLYWLLGDYLPRDFSDDNDRGMW